MVKLITYSSIYKEQIIDLILTIQQSEFGLPVTIEQQPDLQDIPNVYQKSKGNFWVATVDNHVVGTIALLDIGNDTGALKKMFVAPAFRGKQHGIGQALLDTLLEWAKQKKFAELFLGTVEEFVAAQRFYEKNGFHEVDKLMLPETFPVMPVDVKFYKYTMGSSKF